jgi:hypothetical protein
MTLTDDERKALTAIAQSRNGVVFLSLLERRKQEHVNTWSLNLDDKISAHLRGKVSEINELTQVIQTLSKSKE